MTASSKGTSKFLMEKYRVTASILDEAPEGYDLLETYDWRDYLDRADFKTTPVERFKTAPLSDIFHHLRAGLKVEVPNKDYAHYQTTVGGVYWVAFVVKVSGFRALLRYEGYALDGSADFWMNLCSKELHYVGWCAAEGRPLVPPKALQDRQEDWKQFLVKRLTGARTLPGDWADKVRSALALCPFRAGQRLEVVDRLHPERVRPCIIKRVIGGRLFLGVSTDDTPSKDDRKEDEHPEDPTQGGNNSAGASKTKPKDAAGDDDDDDDDDAEDEETWVDQHSALAFPVGWATRVGYGLWANRAYKEHCEEIAKRMNEDPSDETAYAANDCKPSMFRLVPKAERKPAAALTPSDSGDATAEVERSVAEALIQWREGMKLECIDPLEMNSVNVATVAEVLNEGYLRVTFDGNAEDDVFVFHHASPYLFPIGFCLTNAIELRPPKGATAADFSWQSYLTQTKSVGAPLQLFADNSPLCPEHCFEVGSKIECVDMVEPKLVCVATVVERKAARLLKIRFDGWGDAFDQWADFRSPNMHPVGWCETVGYKLEAPKRQELEGASPSAKRAKSHHTFGGGSAAKKHNKKNKPEA